MNLLDTMLHRSGTAPIWRNLVDYKIWAGTYDFFGPMMGD